MTSYGEYEEMIVALLAREGVDVQPLPLMERLNAPRIAAKPRVYVLFTGSTFEETQQLGDFAQYESLTFGIAVEALTRDGEAGVFEVAEESMQRILKWRPPDSSSRVSLTTFNIVDSSAQNKWQYQLNFNFTRVRIKPPVVPNPDCLGRINEITTNVNLRT